MQNKDVEAVAENRSLGELVLRESGWQWRLARTILQGIVGVVIANLDLIVGWCVMEPSVRALVVALVRYCVRPWYDGSGTLPATGLTREDNPDPGELEIDGILGNLSVTKWQRELSTGIYDGVVSDQWVGCQPSIPNLVSVTWEGDGCSLVAQAMQRKVGAEIDGIIGPKTVRCLQRWLTERWFDCGIIDGILGPKTARAVQRSLNEGVWS